MRFQMVHAHKWLIVLHGQVTGPVATDSEAYFQSRPDRNTYGIDLVCRRQPRLSQCIFNHFIDLFLVRVLGQTWHNATPLLVDFVLRRQRFAQYGPVAPHDGGTGIVAATFNAQDSEGPSPIREARLSFKGKTVIATWLVNVGPLSPIDRLGHADELSALLLASKLVPTLVFHIVIFVFRLRLCVCIIIGTSCIYRMRRSSKGRQRCYPIIFLSIDRRSTSIPS
mmetsp:Transcript_16932/g.40133  ORF Transcript_16932/g.40133 Transcript_16932/m.40133 type:complete len:224 (-) Transcript_16932:141-812(-)